MVLGVVLVVCSGAAEQKAQHDMNALQEGQTAKQAPAPAPADA
jgi:hypothetical protein